MQLHLICCQQHFWLSLKLAKEKKVRSWREVGEGQVCVCVGGHHNVRKCGNTREYLEKSSIHSRVANGLAI